MIKRILRRSSVLSQGWCDPQQGKTFVHIPGMTVFSSSGTTLWFILLSEMLVEIFTTFPFSGVAIFPPQQM
jgi:hypothetical protein